MNADGEQYGLDDLRSMFAGDPPSSSEDANKAIFDAVHEFAQDTPQSDDITCLVLRCGGNGN